MAFTSCNPEYLRRTAQSPAVRAIKERAYELLELTPGDRVLDIGCGPAIDSVALARIVGPTGSVLGIDSDLTMVQEANQIAARDGVGAFTSHIVGSAIAVGIASDSLDACFCDRVLQHVSPWTNAARAVREMVRVVRANGRVVVVDTDWATLSIAAEDPWLERRIVAEHALGFASPYAGRYLPSLLRNGGLVGISVESVDMQLSAEALDFLLAPTLQRGVALGRISTDDVQRWNYSMRASREYGQFFAHLAMVLVAGRKR